MRGMFMLAVSAMVLGCSPSAPDQLESHNGAISEAATISEFNWPETLNAFGNGYPNEGDVCRRLGESAVTAEFLDDSATLVGCPGDETADAVKAVAAAGGKVVGLHEGVTMISVPAGDVIGPK